MSYSVALHPYLACGTAALLVIAALITPPDLCLRIPLVIPLYRLCKLNIRLSARIEHRNAAAERTVAAAAISVTSDEN